MSTPIIIGHERIERELFNVGVDVYKPGALKLADVRYLVPTRKWLETVFPYDCDEFIGQLQASYDEEHWDCDDFTRAAAFLAQLQNSWQTREMLQAGKLKDRASIAFGEFWYASDRHSINTAIVDDNGRLRVMFFEPQPESHVVTLKRNAIETAHFVRF
jgi:hypothetical protein